MVALEGLFAAEWRRRAGDRKLFFLYRFVDSLDILLGGLDHAFLPFHFCFHVTLQHRNLIGLFAPVLGDEPIGQGKKQRNQNQALQPENQGLSPSF